MVTLGSTKFDYKIVLFTPLCGSIIKLLLMIDRTFRFDQRLCCIIANYQSCKPLTMIIAPSTIFEPQFDDLLDVSRYSRKISPCIDV